MKIGKYKLGRLHAIIEKKMEDNSFMYETDFISEKDLQESINAIMHFVNSGENVGIFSDNSMKILSIKVYRGTEAIEKLKSLN